MPDPHPQTPENTYLERQDSHAAERAQWERRRRWLYQAMALLAVVLFALTVEHLHARSPWPLLGTSALFAAAIPLYLRVQARLTRLERVDQFYEQALARVRSEDVPAEAAGEAYRQPDHLYAQDLNLVGTASLFALLDTVRTGVGQRGLAEYLQTAVAHAVSVERQAAVRELAPQVALREQIALLGQTRFEQVEAHFFDSWLDLEAPHFAPWVRPVLAVTATAQVLLLLFGVTHLLPWTGEGITVLPNLLVAAAVQTAICYGLRERVKPLLLATEKLRNHVQMFSDGLRLLDAQHFHATLLLQLQAAAREPAGAVGRLRQLQSQVQITQQRTKELFALFSLLLAAGTQAAITLAAWKRANGEGMRGWLAVWAEFEALNALAAFAFEHPAYTWPELLPPSAAPRFQALALAHPLLPEAVANDVALGPERAFYLISGSNMSGKSTLLRSVGVNAVLAYAGAPVRAASLRLSTLRLGAALALTDSLAEGKSKFLAEVDRLQRIVAASADAPVLFLVDEIFSGTNSADRRMAAQAVLQALLGHGAIGALSTHDLALTDLASVETRGENVHMASPDAADPLAFDYRLKPGVNTSSNALAIIRMMGLSVPEQ